jgi:hypothetical protein
MVYSGLRTIQIFLKATPRLLEQDQRGHFFTAGVAFTPASISHDRSDGLGMLAGAHAICVVIH